MKTKSNPNFEITQENGVFIARCLYVEVSSHGATEKEAIANLEEALAMYFEDLPGPADG